MPVSLARDGEDAFRKAIQAAQINIEKQKKYTSTDTSGKTYKLAPIKHTYYID